MIPTRAPVDALPKANLAEWASTGGYREARRWLPVSAPSSRSDLVHAAEGAAAAIRREGGR